MAASDEAINRAAGQPAVGRKIAAARAAVIAGQREHVVRALFDLSDPCLRRYIGGIFQGLATEQLHAFFLNKEHCYIADERLGEGGGHSVAGSLRRLVTRALDLGASGIVLAHNHPSGRIEPSETDIKATRKMASSLADLELTLADHIIVGAGTMYSMRGAGQI